MNPLDSLAAKLTESLGRGHSALPTDTRLDALIGQLQGFLKAGSRNAVSADLQLEAVRKFWETMHFATPQEGRLVAFSLNLPISTTGPCIIEDRQRFQAALDGTTGVEQWSKEPRLFRRCYQGLVRSYFSYNPAGTKTPKVGRDNWHELRDYLKSRATRIVDPKINPDWVVTVTENRKLFSEDPSAPYAAEVLRGNMHLVDRICERLGINKSSWFLEELVLAQVRQAATFGHKEFTEMIPLLLDLIADNPVLRDRGMQLLLNRYAAQSQPPFSEVLRNAAVDWWGNPWLPSNEARWGGVKSAAREMIADWLKREFIDAFFSKLAEDGVGDRRRAEFWLRYAKSMDNIQFGLGSKALSNTDRDFVALRKKMAGLYTQLKTSDSGNNAFIMTLGNLVAVEFGGMNNAFYGYDLRKRLPFDPAKPLGVAVGATNSLKNKSHILWMQHQDGIKGWSRWEEMFEATLKHEFGILPGKASVVEVKKPPGPSKPSTPASKTAAPEGPRAEDPYSPAVLQELARIHRFKLEDLSGIGGNLWALTDNQNLYVNAVLTAWKFRYKPNKGWWRG